MQRAKLNPLFQITLRCL